MLQRMRDGAQTLGARILVGIIVVVLTVFGFGAFNLFAVGEPVAATVNGQEITEAELEFETERRRRTLLAQLGEDADPDSIDAALLRSATLNGLIERALLAQFAGDLEVAVAEARLNRETLSNSDFQVEGAFDPNRFRAVLASAGFSPLSYQERVAADARLTQVTGGFGDTALLTDREVRDAARFIAQRRDVAWLSLPAAGFDVAAEISEDDVEAAYDAERERYQTPETLNVEYVSLSLPALMAAQSVTEDELRAAFDEEAEERAATAAGRRRGAHILLETGADRTAQEAVAQLAAIRAEIEAGADFAEKARALSEDRGSAAAGGDLGFADRSDFVAPFADALWALEVGELSEPVTSEFGVHLIVLLEIEAIEAPTFEASRERLEAAIRRQRAEAEFDEQLRQMDEIAFEDSHTLAGVEEALGLPLRAAEGITRAAGPAPFDDAGLRQAMFEADVLAEGYNSPAVRVGEDAVVARVALRHEPAEQPLTEVSDAIRAELAAQRSQEAAAIAAVAAVADLRKGLEAADIAVEHGSEWAVQEGAQAGDSRVPQAVIDAAFRLDPPLAGERAATSVELPDGHAVVTVTRVEPGDYGAMTESDRAALREQLNALARQRDLAGLVDSLRADASLD